MVGSQGWGGRKQVLYSGAGWDLGESQADRSIKKQETRLGKARFLPCSPQYSGRRTLPLTLHPLR